MGIRGLLFYCLRRREECVDEVDLVVLVKSRGGIEIIVDFYFFEYMVVFKFWKGFGSFRNNQFFKIFGGEYKLLEIFIKRFIEIFRQFKILFVFIQDVIKGCSEVNSQQKLDIWMKRYYKEVENLNEVINVCRGRKEVLNLDE